MQPRHRYARSSPRSRPEEPTTTAAPFTYLGYDLNEAAGRLRFRYGLDRWKFEEVVTVEAGAEWSPAAYEAARLAYLMAGVSYYKAAAPLVVDLGATPVGPGEVDFVRTFYREGLGEFSYRNELDLGRLEVVGGRPHPEQPALMGPARTDERLSRPLIPFGGGLDSIVTVELVRVRSDDAALFVLSRPDDRFAAIEAAAAITGLPVLRAGRLLDEQILRSDELGFRNGHVPITGILSAVAVLVAALAGRDSVVMSNEQSASAGNLTVDGREINHQWSKGADFEQQFSAVVDRALGGAVRYFSALRDRSELWIAERFAAERQYHRVFRSCNRAFALDPARRLDRWCGTCDKCCFVDLVLAPFLAPGELRAIFDDREPLENPDLAARFRTLVGVSGDPKPWECVGDLAECRTALTLAADRPDRAGNRLLAGLAGEVRAQDTTTAPARQ